MARSAPHTRHARHTESGLEQWQRLSDMNWRQGLFRVWATLSLAWVALIAIYAYSKLPVAYQEFQRARDASTIKVISPTYADVYEVVEALEVIEALKVDIPAPPCRDGDKNCEPQDRQSRGTPPGTMVDAAGSVVGPFSAFDHATALAEWVEASRSRANFLAWLGFAPPILLGALILALGWVPARFERNKPRTEA